MKNQFFYTRRELKSGTPENPVYNVFRDSFNLNLVIRTVAIEDGRLLVLLNDIHERAQEIPEVDVRTNKVKGVKRQRNTFQSEIYLEPEDVERFYAATNLV
jgi:hypothetical protein